MTDKIEEIVRGGGDVGGIDLSTVKMVDGEVIIDSGNEENSRKAHRYSAGKGCLLQGCLITGGMFVGGATGAGYGVAKLIEYFC
ncbi:hypothetical protein GOV12_02155 [Candidatus Pacearchaeota archaeon]|nr:hypothetical protein [Candidatus Pacearchaeota archaeon]